MKTNVVIFQVSVTLFQDVVFDRSVVEQNIQAYQPGR